jgi:hypothetical protein
MDDRSLQAKAFFLVAIHALPCSIPRLTTSSKVPASATSWLQDIPFIFDVLSIPHKKDQSEMKMWILFVACGPLKPLTEAMRMGC